MQRENWNADQLSYPMSNKWISRDSERGDGFWINMPHTSIQVENGLLFIGVHKSEAIFSLYLCYICLYMHWSEKLQKLTSWCWSSDFKIFLDVFLKSFRRATGLSATLLCVTLSK